jgi:ElaB/YqjD/DUF883 family membrane-anchored ribosome-binding protein
MDTASDVSESAREAARDTTAAAADATSAIQKDLQALRDDLARLAEEIGGIVSTRGNAAWTRAKTSVDGVVSDAQVKGQEAVDAVREISDNFVDAIDDSIKNRPYTTLALAVGLGVLLGATWRR